MGGAPYIGPRLGGGPIFEGSLSQLNVKERPGELPTRSSLARMVAVDTIDFSLPQVRLLIEAALII